MRGKTVACGVILGWLVLCGVVVRAVEPTRSPDRDKYHRLRNHLEDKYTNIRVPAGKFAETILK
jgi:hypothetical protein